MIMIEMSQMILIAGAGQNVGKTTLACRIIQQLSKENETTGLKISNHKHTLTEQQKIILQIKGLTIAEELDNSSNKDSSLFLQNGAQKSFFIQVEEDKQEDLAKWIHKNIQGWIVCESASIGRFIAPGKALYLEKTEGKVPDWKFPYQTVNFNGKDFIPKLDDLINGLK